MNDIIQVFATPGIAQTLIAISMTAMLGILLGKIKFFGIRIGIAGALFSGLAIGAFGLEPSHDVLHFVKEFGLILFVFAIGLQVGPGFFSSFRRDGLQLNLLAVLMVTLNVLFAVLCLKWFELPIDAAVGVLSGAVTNTPGLGAAQQVLAEQAAAGAAVNPATAGMAYAVAYPFGIIGIILAMILVRLFFKVNPEKEHEKFLAARQSESNEPIACNVELRNGELAGRSYASIIRLAGDTIVLSRRLRQGELITPRMEDRAETGDILLAVGSPDQIERLKMVAGGEAGVDLRTVNQELLASRKVLITNADATRKTLRDLNLPGRFQGTIVRIYRAGVVFTATPERYLHIGDMVTVVAPTSSIEKITAELGNSPETLNHPNLLPIFLGMFLGVLVGSISIALPGVPAPVKLGLAGGPLIVAILMGWKGKIGPVNFYQTPGANMIIREIGILLFLASVGLASGKTFLPAFTEGDGFLWMKCGMLITFIPVFTVGMVGRLRGINYLTLIGTMAGANTDPPAIEYANSITPSPAPLIGYAAVYPFTMLMRVFVAQLFVILLL